MKKIDLVRRYQKIKNKNVTFSDISNEMLDIYMSYENIINKSGGWPGKNAFYNPSDEFVLLPKVSVSYPFHDEVYENEKTYHEDDINDENLRRSNLLARLLEEEDRIVEGYRRSMLSNFRLKHFSSLKGEVLWFRKRDGVGIIIDGNKREYFFDVSVLRSIPSEIKRGDQVHFDINPNISDCLCATNIRSV